MFDSAFNTSFGNQVLCYAWLSTAVYLICACLPASIHRAVMMSAIGVLRVAWKVNVNWFLIHFFFSISLRILLCVHFLCIMLAAPPKPLNNKKKHPWKEKSACFFSMDWIELCWCEFELGVGLPMLKNVQKNGEKNRTVDRIVVVACLFVYGGQEELLQ